MLGSNKRPRLAIQLWSIYYAPVPTGIGPVSTVWAQSMRDRGHNVTVVTSHPHYPAPAWGRRLAPYREFLDGIPVWRLPLMVGRSTPAQRLRQELSFAVAQSLAIPRLATPDVIVAVSPSFPALAPAMANARLRRRPWVLWLQDILPAGAESTGLLTSGALVSAARRLEIAAYRSANRIVVISKTFDSNLRAKGVRASKLELIYNPATRRVGKRRTADLGKAGPRILSMGNIGLSQGLARAVEAFEDCQELARANARMLVAGHGVAAGEVEAARRTDRVEMLGLLSDEALEAELQRASIGLVTQRPGIAEFNLPSKLMNFMAYGIPVVASVNPESETAQIVHGGEAGWVVDCADPGALCATLVEALSDPAELERRGASGLRFAESHFTSTAVAEQFERVLLDAVSDG